MLTSAPTVVFSFRLVVNLRRTRQLVGLASGGPAEHQLSIACFEALGISRNHRDQGQAPQDKENRYKTWGAHRKLGLWPCCDGPRPSASACTFSPVLLTLQNGYQLFIDPLLSDQFWAEPRYEDNFWLGGRGVLCHKAKTQEQ